MNRGRGPSILPRKKVLTSLRLVIRRLNNETPDIKGEDEMKGWPG